MNKVLGIKKIDWYDEIRNLENYYTVVVIKNLSFWEKKIHKVNYTDVDTAIDYDDLYYNIVLIVFVFGINREKVSY